jgi:eukaryotic translation initiation factor 2C
MFFPLSAGLLEMFMSRNNGKMPKQIIIYRDGVSDSQFGSILLSELPSIKGILQ